MDNLTVCCLIAKYLEIFKTSVCYWFITWFYFGQRMDSVELNLKSWRLVSWPFICFHLMNVPYAFEKNMYSAIVWYIVLYMSVKSSFLVVLLLSSVSLLIFCLHSINCWERSDEISYYNYVFVYFSFLLSVFTSYILKPLYLLHIY